MSSQPENNPQQAGHKHSTQPEHPNKKGVQPRQMQREMGRNMGRSMGGQRSHPLDALVQAKMERSFHQDFSDVKVTENSAEAENMGALAFTQGQDVHFAPGQYNPTSGAGQELIGHELTHVVQQQQGRVKANQQAKGVAVNDDPALEQEADVMGRKAAAGKNAKVVSSTKGSIQKASSKDEIEKLAKQVYNAIKGAGTDEEAIHQVLNHGPQLIRDVILYYNQNYNTLSGKGMVQDIINDTSGGTLELMLYQIKRAGVAIPESKVDNNISIVKEGLTADKTNVQPGTTVKYAAPDGYESYKWIVLNNPYASEIADRNEAWYESVVPIYEGPSRQNWSGTWDYPGVHTVACRVKNSNGQIFYLERQEVVGSFAEDIPKEHVSYEILAHHVAYIESKEQILQEKNTVNLLTQWGYDVKGIKVINGAYDLNLTIIPALEGQSPVIAFRGTSSVTDVLTDLDKPGPGYYQYYLNKDLIADVFNSLSQKTIVTGHSLGGALAQYAAVEFPGKINSVVTFQSPGINIAKAIQFNNYAVDQRPEVTHHIANNDVVDLAGDMHIEGDFYLHQLKNYVDQLSAHTTFIFTSPAFKEFRALMGLPDNYYKNTVGKEMLKDQFFIEKFNRHPNPVKKAIIESIRG